MVSEPLESFETEELPTAPGWDTENASAVHMVYELQTNLNYRLSFLKT